MFVLSMTECFDMSMLLINAKLKLLGMIKIQ